MSRRDPLVAIHHMRDYGKKALELVEGRTQDDLYSDFVFDLALRQLMQILGEASRRVPPSFRARYPDVPWRDVADLRNRLIHGYEPNQLR